MFAIAGIVVTEISTPMSAPDLAEVSDSTPAVPARDLTQLLHDDARIGTSDVAEITSPSGLRASPGRCTTFATGRGGRQQLKRFPRLIARGDNAKVDHA